MRKQSTAAITNNPYPHLSDWHYTKLLEVMSVCIIRARKKVLNGGAIVLDYPSAAVVWRGGVGQRRPYLGYLQPKGIVLVRTIDGIEVASVALGYAWHSPAFEAHRQAAAAKKGKQ